MNYKGKRWFFFSPVSGFVIEDGISPLTLPTCVPLFTSLHLKNGLNNVLHLLAWNKVIILGIERRLFHICKQVMVPTNGVSIPAAVFFPPMISKPLPGIVCSPLSIPVSFTVPLI